jgi:hypothetical protein
MKNESYKVMIDELFKTSVKAPLMDEEVFYPKRIKNLIDKENNTEEYILELMTDYRFHAKCATNGYAFIEKWIKALYDKTEDPDALLLLAKVIHNARVWYSDYWGVELEDVYVTYPEIFLARKKIEIMDVNKDNCLEAEVIEVPVVKKQVFKFKRPKKLIPS